MAQWIQVKEDYIVKLLAKAKLKSLPTLMGSLTKHSNSSKPNQINIQLAIFWFELHKNKAKFDSWIEGTKLPSIQL